VNNDAHQLRASGRERGHLAHGARNIGGVRVRHGLHDDRVRRPHGDGADQGGDGGPAGSEGHSERGEGKGEI
jgi:hypothetical protein